MNRAMPEAALDPETVRQLLNHAISLGFACDRVHLSDTPHAPEETWQVTSAPGHRQWVLQLSHSRWLLVIQGTSQIRFSHQEALVFLERLSRDTQLRSQVASARTHRARATV
ncbi:hypothetical protein GS597_16710 [Synechococcales cyanobacterium C]|uniref:Uncharacterized protein n=1 Tax=Petrachloros mirabilis ULC683 TaxID=2781853 RepID=A0A8K2A230_9CYAN|nr:hypothetical protein [Petrachloros mirabilis]NCJ08117.1 hypothetical protein [Petrachloros mirabilis ULC683]